ncbi:MAG: hypothetical protein ACOCUS_06925 [Polyangiales bacterium]
MVDDDQEMGEEAEPEAEEVADPLLRRAMELTVERLVAGELIEAEHVPQLTEELTLTASEARNPKALTKRVVRTLLTSELVEEVYSDDDTIVGVLEQAFRDAAKEAGDEEPAG